MLIKMKTRIYAAPVVKGLNRLTGREAVSDVCPQPNLNNFIFKVKLLWFSKLIEVGSTYLRIGTSNGQ